MCWKGRSCLVDSMCLSIYMQSKIVIIFLGHCRWYFIENKWSQLPFCFRFKLCIKLMYSYQSQLQLIWMIISCVLHTYVCVHLSMYVWTHTALEFLEFRLIYFIRFLINAVLRFLYIYHSANQKVCYILKWLWCRFLNLMHFCFIVVHLVDLIIHLCCVF